MAKITLTIEDMEDGRISFTHSVEPKDNAEIYVESHARRLGNKLWSYGIAYVTEENLVGSEFKAS